MKKLLILAVLLAGCKKQQTQPQSVTQSNPVNNPDTVVISLKAYGGGGTLKANFGENDTIISYSPTLTFTKILDVDSIKLNWKVQACTVCSYGTSDVMVTVNGLVKANYLAHSGNKDIWVKL